MEKAVEEKGRELVEKFANLIGSNCEHDSYCDKAECHKTSKDYAFCSVDYEKAKGCAMIFVDEQITLIDELNPQMESALKYWNSVKSAIEKL